MSGDFSVAGYRALLAALLECGYEARGYPDAQRDRRDVILRHDIDISLEAALAIAEIEHSLGLKAHYFVLVRSEMYNVLSAKASDLLRCLSDLGHAVGLHLDASLYDNDPAKLEKAAEQECGVLESAVGRPVHIISFHRPAPSLLGYTEPLAGRPHAYQPRYFSEIGYCSDSRGAWHHGHPLAHPAVKEGRALQLLTHPIWWNSETNQTVQHRLDQFAYERYCLLRTQLSATCEAYDFTLPPLLQTH